MTTALIMMIVFAVSMISAAWVIPRKRAARMCREAEEDAAIRDLYDHYVAGVDSLAQVYLLQAPSDEEWLAGITEKGGAAASEPRMEVIRSLISRGAGAGIRDDDARRCRDGDSEAFWGHLTSWRHLSGVSLLAGILIAVASLCVLGHLAASWLLPILGIAAPVALGVLAGHVVGFRPSLPEDPFEPDRERVRRPRDL